MNKIASILYFLIIYGKILRYRSVVVRYDPSPFDWFEQPNARYS